MIQRTEPFLQQEREARRRHGCEYTYFSAPLLRPPSPKEPGDAGGHGLQDKEPPTRFFFLLLILIGYSLPHSYTLILILYFCLPRPLPWMQRGSRILVGLVTDRRCRCTCKFPSREPRTDARAIIKSYYKVNHGLFSFRSLGWEWLGDVGMLLLPTIERVVQWETGSDDWTWRAKKSNR